MQIALIFTAGILVLAYMISYTHDVFSKEQSLTICNPIMNLVENREG